jgi:H+/Cl- antiporter ClcA
MNKTVFHLFVVIGAVFSLLASLIAYLVIYKEAENHYLDKKVVRKKSLEMEVFTFIFFFLLMLVIGYFI